SNKTTKIVAISALVIAILGFGTSALTYASKPQPCATGVAGVNGAAGVGAYQLWLTLGNTGTEQDFLDSLTGKQGKPGTDGLTGATGKSAYQLWLAAGNKGTTKDFLNSLVGDQGATGLSAYELWLKEGNAGSANDFLRSLVGAPGANGANGTNGTNGTNGSNGTNGLSAYDLWVANGHPNGTLDEFFTSLQGPQGVAGTCTATSVPSFNYYGSFYDDATQPNPVANALHAMRFNQSTPGVNGVFANGVSIVDGTKITFAHAGIYNIQFSAQMEKSTGGSDPMDIWLSYKGTALPATDTQFQLGTTKRFVAAWNFFVSAGAGDWYEINWISPDVTQDILAAPARTVNGVTIPAIPSLILTVNQVGN
ncbi:MAG: hypothetical protein RL719_409, partial [Actinomycetota bacterium]